MPRGPLPDPNAQRRNAPTIPVTELPAEGYQGEIPDVPCWVTLEAAGARYWSWAWRTQEAAAWGTGAVSVVARRAALEDDLAAIELATHHDLGGILESAWDRDKEDFIDLVSSTFRVLGKLAGGKARISAEMLKMDEQLGLTPKARAQLRWTVKGESTGGGQPQNPVADAPPEGQRSRDRLKVVSGGAG